MTLAVALAPGDGVGPTVVGVAARVLDAVADARGIDLDTERFDLGTERLRKAGTVMAPGTMDRLRTHDAVLLGAVGNPEVGDAAVAKAGHHRIRREFDLWCNRRPARLLVGGLSPLLGYEAGDVDLLWVRENREGSTSTPATVSIATARPRWRPRRQSTPAAGSNGSSATRSARRHGETTA